MNAVNPLHRSSSTRVPWLRMLAVPVVLATLLALPSTSHARGYVSINFGPAYPAYPVYAYPAYPVYSYPAYYPAYPRYYHHYRHHYVATTYTSVDVAPPPLPVYEQPPIPGDGYVWTPGYWAYGASGYYWVPGTWVLPPYAGALWTPGYWGWDNGYYAFSPGYWGLSIGFYGGINYGFGYGGIGYDGGYWRNGVFFYNRTVNNIGTVNVRNVYNRTVINNTTINRTAATTANGTRTSFNGGTGGVTAKPTAAELAAAQQRHTQPVAAQQRQLQLASRNRAMLASVNHGAPAIAATQKAGAFSGAGIVKAHDVSPQDRAAVARAELAKPVRAATRAASVMGASHGGSMLARGNAQPHYSSRYSNHVGAGPSMREPFMRGQPMQGWSGPRASGRMQGMANARSFQSQRPSNGHEDKRQR